MAVEERRRSAGVLVLQTENEVWVADPDAIVVGESDWLKLDRSAVEGLHRMFGDWLEENK